MTARSSVKNGHIEDDLILVLKKTDTYSQGYYCQTKSSRVRKKQGRLRREEGREGTKEGREDIIERRVEGRR
jgi:hypothetical protein